ncbi:MAG: ThuA domain-containing protein, partial [Acidimicrobiia bacterium]
LVLLIGCSRDSGPPKAVETPSPTSPKPFRIFALTKTAGFRHDSIPAGLGAIVQLGREGNYRVDSTESLPEDLSPYQVVVFLNTTGDVLDASRQSVLEKFVRDGGGFVGIHSATDTEYDWPFYGQLVGAYFADHPAIQKANVLVKDSKHPSTAGLPATWVRTDEWYNFRASPTGKVHVLLTIDEKSYQGGKMGADHPIAWCHPIDAGRSFFTGGGHTVESFSEPEFRSHLLGGITWAAETVQGNCSP